MSAGPDGSIIVDTRIDPQGFKAGSAQLKGAIKSLGGEMKSLGNTLKGAVSGSEGALQEFNTKAQTLEDTIADLEADLESLGNTSVETDDFKRLSVETEKAGQNLERLLNRQERMQENGVSENSAQWKNLARDLESASQQYDRLAASQARMKADGTAYTPGYQTPQYTQMQTALAAAKARLAEMKGELATSDSFMHRLTSSARSFLSTMRSAAVTVGSKLVQGIKSAAGSVQKMLSNSKMMKNSFNNLSFLLRRIGPSLLMTEGVFGLLRKAVSAFLQQNQQLSAQLNSCWSGIGNILGPIITRLINIVATAVAYVTQFLRLLGFVGSSTKQAISGAGGAAKKETEELQRQLASFDELNVLSDNQSDSDGGGGGGVSAGETPEVTLPDWVQMMVDHLKSGEWAKAATVLTDELNAMVDRVDWAGIGDKIGYYLNAALTFLATAILNFDWHNLGVKLATCINHIIDSVDWRNLGVVLGAKFIALIGTLAGLFETLDWGALGRALADTFSGLWDAIDWAEAGKMISDGIIGVCEFAIEAIKTVDWAKVGRDIATFLKAIDWGSVASAVWEAIKAAFSALGQLLLGLLTELFADPIQRVGANMEPEAKAAGADIVGGIIVGIFEAMAHIAVWIYQNMIKPLCDAFCAGLGIKSPSTVFAQYGGFIVAGLLQGLTSGWGSIMSFLASALSEMSGNMSSWWQKIGSGASSAWAGIRSTISDAWSNIRSSAASGYNSIANGVSSAWANVKSWSRETWSNVRNWVSSSWNDARQTITSVGAQLQESVSNTYSRISEYVSSNLQQTESNSNGIWSQIREVTAGYCSQIYSDASSTWSQIKSNTASSLNSIRASAVTNWNSMSATVRSAVSGMASNASSSFSSIQSTISSKINSALSVINTGFPRARQTMVSNMQSAMYSISNQGWGNVGAGICSGIQSGILSGWPWLNNTVANLAYSLLRSAKNALGIHSPSTLFKKIIGLNIGYGVGEGIEDSTPSVIGSVAKVADAIAAEFKKGEYTTKNIIPTAEINGKLMTFADTITEGFTALLEKLQTIAENVTFKVPLAASSLVPYSTSSTSNSGGTGNPLLDGLSLEQLISLFTQLFTNQTASIVAAIQEYSGTTVNLDKDSLTTMIIEEINRRTKSTGKSPILI